MTKKTAFRIFLAGTLSSAALFLYLTYDTHRQVSALSHADRLSPQVVSGKKVFEKYNCNDCHTILGFGAYYAPDLTKVVARLGDEGIRYRIKTPEKAFENSFRKMPVQNLSNAEIDGLIAFFRWVGEIENGDWPPQDSKNRLTRAEELMVSSALATPGAAVFKSRGCMGCHAIGGAGGKSGPSLDKIGNRMSTGQLSAYVKDPKSQNPGATMPQQALNDKELKEISVFLSKLK